MAIFRRKSAAAEAGPPLDTDGEWALGEGEINGRPLIARWDVEAKRNCPDRSRPVKVTVGVQCAETRPDGLPAGQDLELLEAMEQAMFDELPSLAGSQPVLVVTNNGMREWIIYASSHEWLESWAPGFRTRFMRGRPGKIDAVRDADWQTFKEWTTP
ncbi:MAG TPA: DUF695 domain-containing protein [Mycobacteriales bacterium]|nr:DUF695 domain-containing protein [Mycobacteriales bacterium]